MQREPLEGDQKLLDNLKLCQEVRKTSIVQDAYAPMTPDAALEQSVYLATTLVWMFETI
jgi:hypothetical protein